MTTIVSDAAVSAWIALMRGQTRTVAMVEQAVKAAGFPSIAWYDVLWELARGPAVGLRPRDLQQRLLISQPNVSRLLDRLAAAGLIARCRHSEDGRGQLITLTDKGRALRAEMWPTYAAALHRAIGAHLSEQELMTLAELLGRLAPPR